MKLKIDTQKFISEYHLPLPAYSIIKKLECSGNDSSVELIYETPLSNAFIWCKYNFVFINMNAITSKNSYFDLKEYEFLDNLEIDGKNFRVYLSISPV